PFSATPAWWQLLKALYEVGVEVVATPYQGPAIESLWWRAEPNPAKLYGDSFKAARDLIRRVSGEKPPVQIDETVNTHDVGAIRESPLQDESLSDRLVRQVAQTTIAPLWHRH